MLTTPPTEYVFEISQVEMKTTLENHFKLFYQDILPSHNMLATSSSNNAGVERYYSGIDYPFTNALFGYLEDSSFDACIEEQLCFFKDRHLSFVWYLDVDTPQEIKDRLVQHGFQDVGIMRGVIGALDKTLSMPAIPDGYTLGQVEDAKSMDEYNALVCDTFAYPPGLPREMYQKAMWNYSLTPGKQLLHWIARKDGKPVAAVSTLIDGNLVSFWNGATLPELRKHGLSTALRTLALKDAISKGCEYGASFLMAEGLAYGICSKFGFETKWRFHAFLSPSNR